MSMMSRYYERAYRKGDTDYHAREKVRAGCLVCCTRMRAALAQQRTRPHWPVEQHLYGSGP